MRRDLVRLLGCTISKTVAAEERLLWLIWVLGFGYADSLMMSPPPAASVQLRTSDNLPPTFLIVVHNANLEIMIPNHHAPQSSSSFGDLSGQNRSHKPEELDGSKPPCCDCSSWTCEQFSLMPSGIPTLFSNAMPP